MKAILDIQVTNVAGVARNNFLFKFSELEVLEHLKRFH